MGRPPQGQPVNFGEKFMVFEVDEKLPCVVEMILVYMFYTQVARYDRTLVV